MWSQLRVGAHQSPESQWRYKLSGYAQAQLRLTQIMASHRALMICCSLSAFLCSSLVASAPADVNCTRRQDFNAVRGCCSIPTFHFEAFGKQCGRYMPDGGPRVSPCLYDCIFNATKILNGSELDVANARSMLQRLLGNNQDFLDVYLDGMLQCPGAVEAMMRARRPRPVAGVEQCSPVPLYYGICTTRYVFNYCPSSSWSYTELCETARLQDLNCPTMRASRGARPI
ncbi:uncharacterized protein LOC111075899 [Drosophila obscura]|uniref:uncharacterized protein LOC111075899 n=1 Tax=Drosophila obscura TaxID=7282 RepID=UPI001BB21858|nr:uncharacterized protein LOC111075899 [Drosophila obscura]